VLQGEDQTETDLNLSSVDTESLQCRGNAKTARPFVSLTMSICNTDIQHRQRPLSGFKCSRHVTYSSMSGLSALGLLRSRGPRAFASIATPQRLHRQRPIHVRATDNATIIKDYEQDVQTVLADPTLDDEQKFRTSKRLFALIDHRVAVGDALRNHRALTDAFKHCGKLDPTAQSEYYQGPMLNMLQQQLAMERKKSTLLWQAHGLVVFAPLADVNFSERVMRLIEVLVVNGLLAPFRRLRLRSAVSFARILPKIR